MEDEARAEAERINAWADEALGHGDLSAFGVDDESFIAGALWYAERVIRTKNLYTAEVVENPDGERITRIRPLFAGDGREQEVK